MEKILEQYRGIKIPKHEVAQKCMKIVGKKKFDKYFKFTVVRNPWDRMVSMYHYRLSRKQIPQDTSFNFFVENFRTVFKHGRLNSSQAKYIYNENEELLVDYVGRFECLQQTWKEICKKIDLENIALPHLKGSSHKHYRNYYDNKTKQLVARYFDDDIELFRYSF